MAGVSGNPALLLRSRARDAIFAAGGRGFVRFLPEGGALLVTDAGRRSGPERIMAALAGAGFAACCGGDGLIAFSPDDAAIAALTQACMPGLRVEIDWDGPLHPAQALADRLLRRECAPLTQAGRQLVSEALRLGWLPPGRWTEGMESLRARAAQMLREGDTSGMAEAGYLLKACLENRKDD